MIASREGNADGEKTNRTLAERMERRATLLTRERGQGRSSPVVEAIRQEVGMTLEAIRRARALAQRADKELALAECEVGTDLLQLDMVPPRYVDNKWADRQRLKGLRRELAADRRRTGESHEKVIGILNDRLLALMQRHDLLEGVSAGSHRDDDRPHGGSKRSGSIASS